MPDEDKKTKPSAELLKDAEDAVDALTDLDVLAVTADAFDPDSDEGLMDTVVLKAKDLVDNAADKLVEKAPELTAEGIDKLVDVAAKALPEGQRGDGIAALAHLSKHREGLGKLAQSQLVAFLGHVGLGDNETAVGVYSGTKPGSAWATAHSEIEDSGNKTEQAKRDQDLLLSIAKEIGKDVAKALAALIVAAI
jgi:hypothetical protein